MVGNENLNDVMFTPDDARFGDVLVTTWERLQVDGFLRQTGMWYRLTPCGSGAMWAAFGITAT
jgi:hypothetical protein